MPRGVSQPSATGGDDLQTISDADLERAIVAAMLDGRGAVAEMLAERLRERRRR
jgi:hypothetical protein